MLENPILLKNSKLVHICEYSDMCAAPDYQQNKFGDEFRVFLLINPEDEKPVAVVVPRQSVEPATGGNVFSLYVHQSICSIAHYSVWFNNVPKCQNA